jgi:hypothetical protein
MSVVHNAVPLEFGQSKNIRLLKLDLTRRPTTIPLQFHVTSLDDAPPYIAVSYVWGEPNPTRKILLNERRFTVRRNLWNLLRQMRKVQYAEYIWVDALSIDQDNIPEINYQVAMMGSIYSRAAKTIVWLGAASKDTVGYMQGMREMFHAQNQRQLGRHLQEHRSLLVRPYWSRVWIFQEYWLSNDLDLWCGESNDSFGIGMDLLFCVRSGSSGPICELYSLRNQLFRRPLHSETACLS